MSKTLTATEAAEKADRLCSRDRTVVFTNGCFDILHPGHVHLLRRCSELGDVVFVGLNTDRSVRELKGPGRPLFPLQDRIVMLSALSCVDWIVPFDQSTPAELIRAVVPDVLVKGGDYTPRTVVGRAVVEENGGRVEIVPLLEGYSTSDLIRRLRSGPKGGSGA
ncbi:D-glycero-beta-D-manno-heptose 1-phosphate adenylyltransferase [Candidatus Fermentibacteria bacterium]|nr:D-glycero-beta-D-manno-heptose 1-phosphate adenylyltransferase [Candidatus Fermentibacteria bacterium]